MIKKSNDLCFSLKFFPCENEKFCRFLFLFVELLFLYELNQNKKKGISETLDGLRTFVSISGVLRSYRTQYIISIYMYFIILITILDLCMFYPFFKINHMSEKVRNGAIYSLLSKLDSNQECWY